MSSAKRFKHPGREAKVFSGFGTQTSSRLQSAGRAYFSGSPIVRRTSLSRLKCTSSTPGPGSNEAHASTFAFGKQVSSQRPSKQKFPMDAVMWILHVFKASGLSHEQQRDFNENLSVR